MKRKILLVGALITLCMSLMTMPVYGTPPSGAGGAASGNTGTENSEGSGSVADSVKKGVANVAGNNNPDIEKQVVPNIINTMLLIVGAGAVIMIIYGGIQYIISHGDSGKIAAAKNTILYAVVGLVFAILAYSIVNFVVSKMSGK